MGVSLGAGAVHFLLVNSGVGGGLWVAGEGVFLGNTKETLSVLPEARALSFLSFGLPESGHCLAGCCGEEPL